MITWWNDDAIDGYCVSSHDSDWLSGDGIISDHCSYFNNGSGRGVEFCCSMRENGAGDYTEFYGDMDGDGNGEGAECSDWGNGWSARCDSFDFSHIDIDVFIVWMTSEELSR